VSNTCCSIAAVKSFITSTPKDGVHFGELVVVVVGDDDDPIFFDGDLEKISKWGRDQIIKCVPELDED
jgi:hypothetical protein